MKTENIFNPNIYLDDTLLKNTLSNYNIEYLFDSIKEITPYLEIPKNYVGDGTDFIALKLFNTAISFLIRYASYVQKLTSKSIEIPHIEVEDINIVITFHQNEHDVLKFIFFENSEYVYVSTSTPFYYSNALEINIKLILDNTVDIDELFKTLPIIVNSVDYVEDNSDAKLVGFLNKEFGFNGVDPILPGTPVFESNGTYFFYGTITASKLEVKFKYNKETLDPCIDKL